MTHLEKAKNELELLKSELKFWKTRKPETTYGKTNKREVLEAIRADINRISEYIIINTI